jgi:hypothetical protein
MRGLFLVLVALVGTQAWSAPDSEVLRAALERQDSCDNSIRFDDHFLFLGYGAYRMNTQEPRQPTPGKLRVVPLDGSGDFELSTHDAAIDVITDGGTAYILTYSGIEEWDLASKQYKSTYPTYTVNGPLAYMEHAQAFARYGRKILIAHGRLGVSIFNMDSKRIVNQFRLIRQQAPLESMATGVTVTGNTAYVVLDNFTLVPVGKPPFRGMVTVNMDSETVVSELDGMDPGAESIVSDGSKAIVSFGGLPIWKYDLAGLGGAQQLPAPEYMLFRFPVKGHPTGSAALDAKYYYTCYLKQPAGGLYSKGPMVLNRAQLLLD